jgi:hypothetical protein
VIQPKDLYRKLAGLLENIDEGRTKDDFLFSVLAKLENAFAKDLRIANGRLYREDGDRFLLMNAPNRQESANSEDTMVLDAEVAQLVIRNGSYIYNDASLSINKPISLQREYTIPAAFTVRNPNRRWIFVFALKSGWVREEVEFCLNAVRALLNFRLHADAMTKSSGLGVWKN